MKPPKLIELKPADVEAFLMRVEKGALQEGDYEIIKSIVETLAYLSQAVDEKATAIKRLLRVIFGAKTETREKLFKIGSNPKEVDNPQEESEPEKQPGHGRNGADAYKKAERIKVSIQDLKAGEPCRECLRGRLYPVKKAGTLVRFVGRAPLAAKIYEMEKLRCNLCGEVFTAQPPNNVGSDKYDETAGAMIAMLKYGSGVPFYRIEKLQESMGIPLPASTQWDIVENAANWGTHPAYRELIRQAAQGNVIHNDDTPMKILELLKEINEKSSRTGMFTTGMMSIVEDRKIALFFTGQKHAGENMTDLLKQRQAELDPPIQMCDALSRNASKEFETLLANCLVHGRRNFVDVAANFPEETAHVIDQIALVYKNDETAKEQNLSPQERLLFHQRESAPVMKNLKQCLSEQLHQKKTEPNSGLGKAIAYMLKHWDPLTLFLRVPGAPLDNNLCEQTLKKAILHRKNSLFYKTEHGAFIGDMFMSLIHTCSLGDVNPFDYLVALQKHSFEVFKNPRNWMPWNYQGSLPVNDS
ncbi:MAG: IS66 family transposase [Candidatus Eisenbacteria bacterium]|nr:IS66 family transposase [Candidatus Eisenbacteria bacterium]